MRAGGLRVVADLPCRAVLTPVAALTRGAIAGDADALARPLAIIRMRPGIAVVAIGKPLDVLHADEAGHAGEPRALHALVGDAGLRDAHASLTFIVARLGVAIIAGVPSALMAS